MSNKIARLHNDSSLTIKGELVEHNPTPPVLYFTGVNSGVIIPNTDNRLQPNQQFCWEMWFKLDTYTQYNTLMGFSSNNLDFGRMDATTRFRCHTWDINNSQTFLSPYGFLPVNDDEWHHMVIMWDGVNGVRFCLIDGVQRDYGTMVQGTQIMNSARFSTFNIGCATPYSRTINGWIKEVRLWQIPRTQEEIISTMNIELTGNEDGLQAYYPLNEGSGTVAHDLASGYDGAISGCAWEGETKTLGLTSDGNINLNGNLVEGVNFKLKNQTFNVFEIIEKGGTTIG